MNNYRLSERLKEFINVDHQAKKGKITQKELEDYFKNTQHQRKRQTFSNYLKGKVAMPSDLLFEIANKLNVSADYLLGISDIKTTKENIKAAAKLTGLSEDAIKMLSELNKKGDLFAADFINILLSDVKDGIANRTGAKDSCLGLLHEYYKSFALSDYTIELSGRPEIEVKDGFCVKGSELSLSLKVSNGALKKVYCEQLLKDAASMLDDLSRYEDFKRKEAE